MLCSGAASRQPSGGSSHVQSAGYKDLPRLHRPGAAASAFQRWRKMREMEGREDGADGERSITQRSSAFAGPALCLTALRDVSASQHQIGFLVSLFLRAYWFHRFSWSSCGHQPERYKNTCWELLAQINVRGQSSLLIIASIAPSRGANCLRKPSDGPHYSPTAPSRLSLD